MARRKTAEDYLSEMSDEELLCRSLHRHSYWSDDPDPDAVELPPQVHVTRRRGVFQIEEGCLRDCGRVRVWTTSSGLFGEDADYSYRNRAGVRRVTVPDSSGVRLTPRRCKQELHQRRNGSASRLTVLVLAAAVEEPRLKAV